MRCEFATPERAHGKEYLKCTLVKCGCRFARMCASEGCVINTPQYETCSFRIREIQKQKK